MCPTRAGDSNRPIARTAWARTRGFGSLRPSVKKAIVSVLKSRASSARRMRADSEVCAAAGVPSSG